MDEIYQYLKRCGVYYLGTFDGEQVRVRPFDTIDLYEGKLYIQSARKKDVAKQMHRWPRVELCVFSEGKWLRVAATAQADDRPEVRQHMLAAYPRLHEMFRDPEQELEIFCLTEGEATFSLYSRGGGVEKQVIRFCVPRTHQGSAASRQRRREI